ncbi:MORC family CW-type zinc finger protein 3-like [Anneissia japonica]|uniref:MORC family CW-type zinc finger protein 3-like n=1 Tax=Anneissia japonica TaxID=1529436 RepID=UPI0014256FCC|nr:MORC family CW-type zinc finger protein 3-like [Anneissia japonica]
MASSTNQGQGPSPGPSTVPLSRFSPSYLHTNSTSHAWPFGAIAELIDNAYDPDVNASSMYIDYEEINGKPCLTFTDDGSGLDVPKMHKMLSFGFSDKEEINGKRPIGVYGNGFKSGSMRLGKDAVVFSKIEDSMVIGFLSQTYLKEIKAEDIKVPIVQFNKISKEHELSFTHLKKYSIFKSDSALKEQFDKILSPTGTRIVIYNLSQEKSFNGQHQVTDRYEFDFKKDHTDILIAGGARPREKSEGSLKVFRQQHSEETPKCDYSLKAYCSVLYLSPKIKIYLRKKKVRTVLIAKSLQETEKDVYRPMGGNSKVTITFGFNPKKYPYGVCFYHFNRLIKSYQRLGYQMKADHRGSQVVGVIDCNFLKPTHNKQDFFGDAAYSRCLKAVGDKLNDYWNEKRESGTVAGSSNQFLGNKKADVPDYTWVQCDKCSKWRKLPDSVDPDQLPERWFCSMNKDTSQNNCNVPQEAEDSDDELTRPTYDKKYKKKEADKKLKKKLTESLRMLEEKKREAAQKNEMQKQKEKIKNLEAQLKSKDGTQEKQIKGHKQGKGEEPIPTVPQLLAIKSELVAQGQEIQECIGYLSDHSHSERKRTHDEDCIIITSEEDDPPEKKMKSTSEEEQKPSCSSSNNFIKIKQEPGISTTNQKFTSTEVQTDISFSEVSESDSDLQKLMKSEEKLKNIRCHVARLLKMVVTEEGMQDMIENLQGDSVDEILEDVMSFTELD